MELPSSKVSASNEAINKSTALTGLLSTIFVRDDDDDDEDEDEDEDDEEEEEEEDDDDVSILRFFSCLRVHEDDPPFPPPLAL